VQQRWRVCICRVSGYHKHCESVRHFESGGFFQLSCDWDWEVVVIFLFFGALNYWVALLWVGMDRGSNGNLVVFACGQRNILYGYHGIFNILK
jgi:hypothetical protein